MNENLERLIDENNRKLRVLNPIEFLPFILGLVGVFVFKDQLVYALSSVMTGFFLSLTLLALRLISYVIGFIRLLETFGPMQELVISALGGPQHTRS
jgi:hypothetical protein